MSDKSKPLPWVTLGINHESGEVVIAGFSRNEREAFAKALKREMNLEHPYGQSRSFQFSGSMGAKIDSWLKSEKVPAMERGRIIRSVGREILLMMEQP